MPSSAPLFNVGGKILQTIKDNGYEAFFVGGCVRDFLLQRKINDIDICTSAPPELVMTLFSRTIPTGLQHGTVTVLLEEEMFEVTTYRTESGYQDHRRPDAVRFVSDLREDLLRRDFTINAMAMDEQYNIMDYFQGQEDLSNCVIRAVGNPLQRFEEDALRILRAVRFSCQLGFDIEEQTLLAMQGTVQGLQYVSFERKVNEWMKCFRSPHVTKGLSYLQDLRVFEDIAPFSTFETGYQQLFHYPLTDLDETERWLLLFRLTPQPKPIILDFLKKSNMDKHTKQILTTEYELACDQPGLQDVNHIPHKALLELGVPAIVRLLKLNQLLELGEWDHRLGDRVKHRHKALPIHRKKDLAIDGHDVVQAINKPAGPWIQCMLEDALEKVLNRVLPNEKDALLDEIKRQLRTEKRDAHE